MRLDATSVGLAVSDSDGFIHLTIPAFSDRINDSDDVENNGNNGVANPRSCAVAHIQLERNGGLCVDLLKSGETLYSVLISLTTWVTSTPALASTSLQEYDAVIQYIVRLIRHSVSGFRFQKLAFFEHHLDEPLCSFVLNERLRACMSQATLDNVALCAASLLRGSSVACFAREVSSEPNRSSASEEEAETRQLHQNIQSSRIIQCVLSLLHSLSLSESQEQKRVHETLLTAVSQFYYDAGSDSPIPPSASTADSGCWHNMLRAPSSVTGITSAEEPHADERTPHDGDGAAGGGKFTHAPDAASTLLVAMVRQLSASELKTSAACKLRLISLLAYACANENNAQALLKVLPNGIIILLEMTRSPTNIPIYENCLLCVLRLILCCEVNRDSATDDSMILSAKQPLNLSSSAASPTLFLGNLNERRLGAATKPSGIDFDKDVCLPLLMPLLEPHHPPAVRLRAATILTLWQRRYDVDIYGLSVQTKLISLFVKYMKKDSANSHAVRCEAFEGLGMLLEGNGELQRVAAWTDGLVLKVFADTWREYNIIMPKIAQSSPVTVSSVSSPTQKLRELTTEEIVTQNLRAVPSDIIEVWRTFLFCFSCLIEQSEDNRRMLQSHCTIEELSQRNHSRHLTSFSPSSSTPTTALHINDRLLDPVIAVIKPGMPEPLVHAALRFMLSLSRSVRQLRTAFCEQLVWIEIICLLKSFYPSIRDAPSRRTSSASQKYQESSSLTASPVKSGFLSTPSSTLSASFTGGSMMSGSGRRKIVRPDYSWTSPSRRNRLLAASVLCNMLMAPPKISKLQLLRLDYRDVERDERLGRSYSKFSSPAKSAGQQKSTTNADELNVSGFGFTIQQLLSAYNDSEQQTVSEMAADDDDDDGGESSKHADVNQFSPPSPLSVGSLLRELIEELNHDKQICLTGVWCLMNVSFSCQTVAEKVSAIQVITPQTLEQLLLHCCDEGDLILQCTLGVMRNCVPVDSSTSNGDSGSSNFETDAEVADFFSGVETQSSSHNNRGRISKTSDQSPSKNKKLSANQMSRSIMKYFMQLLVAVMKKYFTTSFQSVSNESQLPPDSQQERAQCVIREQILATLVRFADNRFGIRLLMQTSDALDFVRESLTIPAARAAAQTTIADDVLTVQRLAVSCITLLVRPFSGDDGGSPDSNAAINERRRVFIDRGFARLIYALREQLKSVDSAAGRALLEQVRTALFHLNNAGSSGTTHFSNLSSFSSSRRNEEDDDDDSNRPSSSEPMQIS